MEVTKQVKKTDASKFQQLYCYLEKEEAFGYFEQISTEIWAQFRRDTILEGLVSIRFSKMEEMFGAVNQISSLADVVASVSGEAVIDNEAMRVIKGFKALEQMQQSKDLPCVLTFTGSPEYRLIAYLNPSFFKVSKDQMIGDLNVFCKIQRLVAKNERIELVDLLSGVKNIPMNREQRRTLPKNLSTPPEMRDTVKGPAAVVIPIAIYR